MFSIQRLFSPEIFIFETLKDKILHLDISGPKIGNASNFITLFPFLVSILRQN